MACVFCEIVSGNAPASVVYEDAAVLAFMDLAPITEGHLLVIPKTHHVTIYDTPEQLFCQIMAVCSRLAPALRDVTGCAGVNVYIANEAPAGQVVPHLHVHLVPRYPDDGFGLRFPAGYGHSAPRPQLDDIAARVRSALVG